MCSLQYLNAPIRDIPRCITFAISTFEEPRRLSPSFSPRPGEGLLISATHEVLSFKGPKDSFWKTLDTLYDSLENLQSLRISIPFVDPKRHSIVEEKDAVKGLLVLLPHLRVRKNFSLTFTVEGEPVLWEAPIVTPPFPSSSNE